MPERKGKTTIDKGSVRIPAGGKGKEDLCEFGKKRRTILSR